MANDAWTEESFESMALPLLDPLYNYARWLAHNREEAEDLVQETFAKGLKGFRSFQPGTNFRAWMFRILRNTFLTSQTGLKTISLDSDESQSMLPATEESPESILIGLSNRDLVQAAIEELSPKFREVLLLCDLEELSYKEIAQVLDVPLGTIMSRLARARSSLRSIIWKKLHKE